MKKKIKIDGMSCGHCVAHVKEALEPFAHGEVEVSLENKCATLDTEADEKTLTEALDDAGYDVVNIEEM